MRIGIAVFDKHWVDSAPLFAFLRAFGVAIKGQDTYGDGLIDIKNTHLVVDGNEATWVDIEGFKEFMRADFANQIHYDSLIFNIKKAVTGESK